MKFIDEDTARSIIGDTEAFAAVESVFAGMARGEARNFPVVREAIGHADALYGFKSGIDKSTMTLGVKAGGYWPHNAEHGLTNHQSTVALFDPDTGQPTAMVSGNHLTAMRTAAACAVSIRHLARADAKTLGIVGAGHQAAFQLRAAAAQRDFQRVVAWNRSADKLEGLAEVAAELGLGFERVTRDQLGAQADAIVTITACHEALLEASQIRPGTHLACMGTDTAGKQEIDHRILDGARVFTDEPIQAAEIGECQHAVNAGTLSIDDIIPIGRVINGDSPGRTSDRDITVFDGTGVGLQDLAVARRVVDLAG
ncbi:iminosuccinate reductase BhcD [Salinisphaera sp.]|uniref:iminosuccinate reductase BhcD n=1 Tax=Salinisphaera sp. TaxID=1914330 RepID=UPI002D764DB8|nr:iminosuccinate reductase BhcD [Salinisphaera sp.]HET7315651.1 ornithine cyclodeaminase family protein [Salinisphaera sp.]